MNTALSVQYPFEVWAGQWMVHANFQGDQVQNPYERIHQILRLWDMPIPGSWERSTDVQLLSGHYRRGDFDNPRTGEHAIEHDILTNLSKVRCLGGTVVDGINAMPLSRDEGGGRRGNVEADLFLLVEYRGTYQLVICEVKKDSDTCWYAAVENLRQLKLLQVSRAAQELFHRRAPHRALPEYLPITGLVVAPWQFYSSPGKKANALPHTDRLLSEFRTKTQINAFLAVWSADQKSISRVR